MPLSVLGPLSRCSISSSAGLSSGGVILVREFVYTTSASALVFVRYIPHARIFDPQRIRVVSERPRQSKKKKNIRVSPEFNSFNCEANQNEEICKIAKELCNRKNITWPSGLPSWPSPS